MSDSSTRACPCCGKTFEWPPSNRQARLLARHLAWQRRANPQSSIVRELIVAIDALVGTLERRGAQVAIAWPWDVAAAAGMPGLRARGEV